MIADIGAAYDDEVVINLSELEPHINGPFTPDLSTPLSAFKKVAKANGWPETFGAGLIGSCTNSSYADMTRCESLVRQASDAGLKPKADFFVTPGSEQIRKWTDVILARFSARHASLGHCSAFCDCVKGGSAFSRGVAPEMLVLPRQSRRLLLTLTSIAFRGDCGP